MYKTLKFSIITPSYNQGQYIEDTIKSVLNQNYDNFEHIIIDGGSTDNTIEILKKYKHLKWVSEKDNGQTDAINRGFNLATGDIITWINSDDYYEENVFNDIANYFEKNENCLFLYGNQTYVDVKKNILIELDKHNLSLKNLLENPNIIRQSSSFFHKKLISQIGLLDTKFNLVMDFDYFVRIGSIAKFHYINKNLSYYRWYSDTKTNANLKKQVIEIYKVYCKNKKKIPFVAHKMLIARYIKSTKFLRKLFGKK